MMGKDIPETRWLKELQYAEFYCPTCCLKIIRSADSGINDARVNKAKDPGGDGGGWWGSASWRDRRRD